MGKKESVKSRNTANDDEDMECDVDENWSG